MVCPENTRLINNNNNNKSRTRVVPVVVGASFFDTEPNTGHLEQLGIKNRTRTMQKSALL